MECTLASSKPKEAKGAFRLYGTNPKISKQKGGNLSFNLFNLRKYFETLKKKMLIIDGSLLRGSKTLFWDLIILRKFYSFNIFLMVLLLSLTRFIFFKLVENIAT